MQAQLIALDWGTSSLRAYKLGHQGQVLEQRSLGMGIMHLPNGNDFEAALAEACGDWLAASPDAALIACGMVGSAQGWLEAPYCQAPARLADIGAALCQLRTRSGRVLHIVPGVIQQGRLPNVMRGEETQVLGLLQSQAGTPQPEEQLIGLPGSHSKWVSIAEGTLTHFDTFMTGELYAIACAHSILGRTQQRGGAFDEHAFDRGVGVAISDEGAIGPLATLFSARTLGLTGQLKPEVQADYLSGLMIGHELRALAEVRRSRQTRVRDSAVTLIGNDQLCARYQRALPACGFSLREVASQATETGLWALALAAGLIPSPAKEL